MAFRAKGTVAAVNGGGASTVTPGTPAGAAVNDILIIAVSQDADPVTYTWPTGFTQLYNNVLSADGQTVAVAWKRATGSDSLTVTRGTTSGTILAQCFAWSGRDTTNPPVKSTAATNSTSNASPTTVTANGVTALSGDDLFWLGMLDVTAGTASSTLTQPTGYTSQGAVADGMNNFCVFGAATNDAVAAGATGTVAGSLTHSGGAGWAAFLIRIPALAGGSTFNESADFDASVSQSFASVLSALTSTSLSTSVGVSNSSIVSTQLAIDLDAALSAISASRLTTNQSTTFAIAADFANTLGSLISDGILLSISNGAAISATLTAQSALTASVSAGYALGSHLTAKSSIDIDANVAVDIVSTALISEFIELGLSADIATRLANVFSESISLGLTAALSTNGEINEVTFAALVAEAISVSQVLTAESLKAIQTLNAEEIAQLLILTAESLNVVH